MERMHLSLLVVLCLGVHVTASEILLRQKRSWIIDSFSINEGYEGPFPYTLGTIQIEKNLILFKIHGQGVDEEPKGVLQINSHTGEITVHQPVDYEKFKVFKLIFQAIDRENHVVDTQLGIEIKIEGSNDNSPRFDHTNYVTSIKESTLQGTVVMTMRATDDDRNEDNNSFDLRIVSVTPEPHGLEFYITQLPGTGTGFGTISFYGCLDHEIAEKYTILVEAKDHGKPMVLSSTGTVTVNIEDGNNHLPVITQQTGPGRVKEGQENILVSRLQVTDEDTKHTAAWRAKYIIQGETNNNRFNITTDPETNEGLLYVKKPLNYEDSPTLNISIIVDNEIPYYSCEVVDRSTTGLWKVITVSGVTQSGTLIGKPGQRSSSHQVTVTVEDVNEPPVFDILNKKAVVHENVEPGHNLETFIARDPDVTGGNTVVYKKGEDPADWITVDSKTGKVTTSKIIDRESSFVKDSIYLVTIHAVDNGKPSLTGTATLSIHITDENDNAPFLAINTIDMCQSGGPSLANITALDLDEKPYSGPFSFKLHGNVKDKWRVDPAQGYSVNLVKEKTVHSGHHELQLEVSDLQGKMAVHNLSVTVCKCLHTARPNCRLKRDQSSVMAGGALGIIFFSMLLVAGSLLVALVMSCKKESIPFPNDNSGQHLMTANTETPGTDCKVLFEPLQSNQSRQNIRIHQVTTPLRMPSMVDYNSQSITKPSSGTVPRGFSAEYATCQSDTLLEQHQRKNLHRSMGASSTTTMRHQQRQSQHRIWMGQRQHCEQILLKNIYTLQSPGEELEDYLPHVYVEEGDLEHNFELDAISMPDFPFDPDLNLDFKFSTLASICMPSDSTSYSS
ncbi:cadherin-like protein 26 isoform X1 [Embiotoca jacksoni]|uniref:cadherin-like protein 26 isoform X1 n=1 Tax=Embiotoca jacksoni TaxID=100190 RepID=UPI003703F4E8